MTEKILITSDSTTDLSPELRERYGIELMRLVVNLNDVDHVDGVDITPEDIYRNYETNRTLPKTAAPNLEDCSAFFRKYVEQGYSIVHFTISSEMSSTYQNSVIAAEDFENVYVVDSRNLSTGGGLLVPPSGPLRGRLLRHRQPGVPPQGRTLLHRGPAGGQPHELQALHHRQGRQNDRGQEVPGQV